MCANQSNTKFTPPGWIGVPVPCVVPCVCLHLSLTAVPSSHGPCTVHSTLCYTHTYMHTALCTLHTASCTLSWYIVPVLLSLCLHKLFKTKPCTFACIAFLAQYCSVSFKPLYPAVPSTKYTLHVWYIASCSLYIILHLVHRVSYIVPCTCTLPFRKSCRLPEISHPLQALQAL